MKPRCDRQVFVADGWPFGLCVREHGHPGLCDAHDGRSDQEIAADRDRAARRLAVARQDRDQAERDQADGDKDGAP